MLFDSTKINLGKLNVRSADQASNISIGNTLKVTRYVTAKKNQAFGQQLADQCFSAGSAYKTVDNDYVDAFATKNDK
ncbi:hypothetical protein ACFW1J_04040 [Priestia aryabhattai]|uniref:Uncharacterized protein n=1 Tax=Priestia aryabhattai TaxID=412384 RepID=A0ABD7WNM6_PRIAR|nr:MULTISPECIES: hypothetical protein [Priestia]KJL05164.1 hypothetical protein N178_08110 [Priestia aryabhattai B8W22]MBX4162679.1 hypothetical protein [Priestia megaterium]MBX9966905.1 hypothetical protein [Priestia aryabhattai]MBY0028848.1 hypothetical protein [Priestia aryabhattai]MBZ6487593.1 hypothetical protein [Priestia aryabhattai]